LASANCAFAEDVQFDDEETDGTQIVAAGAAPDRLPAKI
jgi:hypothetical protein